MSIFRVETSQKGKTAAVFVRYINKGVLVSPWAESLETVAKNWQGMPGVRISKGFVFVLESSFFYFRELMQQADIKVKIYTEL